MLTFYRIFWTLSTYFILGVPIFLILRWLAGKYISFQKTRSLIAWAGAILITPLLYAGLIYLETHRTYYYPRHNFDHEKWFTESDKRYEVAKNLIHSKILMGKSKQEVMAFLGDEGYTEADDHWRYYLGFKPKFSKIGSDMLDIDFKYGKVVKVKENDD